MRFDPNLYKYAWLDSYGGKYGSWRRPDTTALPSEVIRDFGGGSSHVCSQ